MRSKGGDKMLAMKRKPKQNGAATVELAILLGTILLPLLFGIIEFSFLLYDKAMITNASREGARAGIVMKIEPEVGLPSYSQGWGPAVDWTDRGQVVQMGQQTCVPVDCYEGVLVTEEFSQSEPDAFQIKFYAPGVGNVRVSWRGADATKEELSLVDLIQLEPQALAEARAAALELEERAYEISKEVYDQTPPAE